MNTQIAHQPVRLLALLISIIVLLSSSGHSQPTGLPVLNLGIGARAQGMGGAFTARSEDAAAAYWNASALTRLQSKELFLYHARFASDFSYQYAAYAQPFKSGKASFSVSLGRFSKGALEARDENRQAAGEFTASDNVAAFAYGRKLSPAVSVGGALNLIQSNIASESSHGAALDLSGSYQFSEETRFAAGLHHMGPSMKFMSESYQLPAQLSMGVSRRFIKMVHLGADAKYGVHDRKMSLSFGGELDFKDMASFRMGYLSRLGRNASSKSFSDASGMGMGVGFNLFSRARLDYAFVPMGELGGAHHMDLVWKFK